MAKIKICGLRRPEDIEYVNLYKPDFCGFIINFPKSHRSIDPDTVRNLVKNLDESIKAVGVFVDQPACLVAELLNDGTLGMAQLHGNESPSYIGDLKKLTDKPVIKAFAVKNAESLKAASKSPADYILLDQGQGSGKNFDWSLLKSAEAKEIFGPEGVPQRAWFLAGGLSPDNIEEAILRFKPYCVDLSSAVETEKVKDPAKIKETIDLVRRI